jgi:hypothetical protein
MPKGCPMPNGKRTLLLLSALTFLSAALCLLADDISTRVGTIDYVSMTDSGIYCDVTIQKEFAQPLNPELSTGTADPSQIMTPGGTTPTYQIAVGMPVKLVIVRQQAVFRFTIGVVDSMTDNLHCTVRVDPASLDQTFQDPVNDNQVRKAGEFLKVGAAVSIWSAPPN